jgi:hypothetical protein
MKMKTVSFIGVVILAVIAVVTFTGCDAHTDVNQFNHEFFPTNHWKVVGQGTNGMVVVETTSTNLLEYLRVHAATPEVGPMTNGQSVRVKMTVRRSTLDGGLKLISSKAYPAEE